MPDWGTHHFAQPCLHHLLSADASLLWLVAAACLPLQDLVVLTVVLCAVIYLAVSRLLGSSGTTGSGKFRALSAFGFLSCLALRLATLPRPHQSTNQSKRLILFCRNLLVC
jgi:hypothetical protein